MGCLTLIMLIPLVKLINDDFRWREVAVWWLAAMAVCAAGIAVTQEGWSEMLAKIGLNMLLLFYMGAGVVLYTAIKSHKLINPVNSYIGLGDILFFVALTPLFTIKQFAWLLVSCMVFSLMWWYVVRAFKRYPKNVPLVATSGIVTCMMIIFDIITG